MLLAPEENESHSVFSSSSLFFEAKVIMFLQLVTEHSVLWLTRFSCPLDPEGGMKAEIQKNL